MTSTRCSGWRRPWSVRAWRAVAPEIGTTAACSNDRFPGFLASLSASAAAYSANDPRPTPYTSSPTANPVTPNPTAATVPARSRPRTRTLGPRKPRPAIRIK